MSTLHKYTSQEALNKVLNTDKDAMKVDIDNATITAGDLEVNTDALETKVDAIIVDLAALEVLLTAVKTQTDKFTFNGNDSLTVVQES